MFTVSFDIQSIYTNIPSNETIDICINAFTVLGKNFLSCTRILYKINTIKALIYQSYNLNSSFELFHNEIQTLINCFQQNNFPLHLIHHQIKSFLNKIDEPITKPQIVPNLYKITLLWLYI